MCCLSTELPVSTLFTKDYLYKHGNNVHLGIFYYTIYDEEMRIIMKIELMHCKSAVIVILLIFSTVSIIWGSIFVSWFTDVEVSDVLPPHQAEEKAMPDQAEIFAECSQKRILGLLAAMLPRLKSVRNYPN